MSLVTRHIFKYLFTSLAFLATVFSLVGFLIPDLLAIVLPICILISVLFTYNKLIADHEMSIFRTCGLSNWRLARPALIMAFFMACFVAFMNIYLVPLSYRHLRDMEHELRNEFSSNFVQDGMFNTLRGVTVYARTRAINGDLDGVFIHSMGQGPSASQPKRNPFTIVAEHGTLMEKEGKKSLLMLFQGTRQEKDEKTGKVSFFHFQTLSYDLDQLATNIQERIIKPYERSLFDLLNPPEADKLPPTTRAQFNSEGHQRLLSPFLVIVFALIGLSALLPHELNRRGRQKRIMAVIGLAASIHIGLVSLINASGRWGITIPLAYLSIALIGVFSLVVLEKQGILAWWRQYAKDRITPRIDEGVTP
ncbi:MAG: hypothetical protein K0R76_873 [Alphaproteobacteria bacterium]|nr:hypothetical protein [Alphaproteobacteria bacterium]